MESIHFINSTQKEETYSSGSSQKNYITQWGQKPADYAVNESSVRNFDFGFNPFQETNDGQLDFSKIHEMCSHQNFFHQPYEIINKNTNENVKTRAIKIIKTFQNILNILDKDGSLPRLCANELEDNSIIFEWVFISMRLGLVIDVEEKDSSWYFVSKKPIGNINIYGSLLQEETNILLFSLIYFILTNK